MFSLQRSLSAYLLFFMILSSTLHADSCASPTAVLSENSTLNGQEISFDDSVNQKEFIYKITIGQDNQELHIKTEKDTTNSTNNVDTYVTLMDSSCTEIAASTSVQTNPRRVSLNKLITHSGNYYVKVKGPISAYDGGVSDNSSGYFQIWNQVDAPLVTHAISLSKTGPSTVASGGKITYAMRVTNVGIEATKTVKIVDTLPSEMSYVSTNSGWSCSASGQVLTCSLNAGVISGNGGNVTLFLTTKAAVVANDTGTTNEATTTVTYNDGDTKTDKDTHKTTIRAENAKIEVTKQASVPIEIVQGHSFQYTLRVKNTTGNAAVNLNNVTLVDDVNPSFRVDSVVASSSDWDCGASVGQHVKCDLKNPLSNWNSASFIINVTAIGAVKDAIENKVTATATSTAGKSLKDEARVYTDLVAESYAMTFSKSSSKSNVTIGDTVDYTFTVTNSSNVPLSSVQVVDTMSSEFLEADSFVNSSGWTCQPIVSNKIDCSTSMAAKSTKTLTVKAKALKIQNNVINTATVTTGVLPAQDANASINILDYASQLSPSKNTSQNEVWENDIFTYTISLSNSGGGEETGIMISDAMPDDFNITAIYSGADWNCAQTATYPSAIECQYNGALAAGASASDINITVKEVKAILTEHYVKNSAVITSDKNPTGVQAEKNVLLKKQVDALSITKSSPAFTYVDEKFDYTITVSNHTKESIDNIRVEDALPSDVSYVDYKSSSGRICHFDANSTLFSCDDNTTLLPGTEEITLTVKAGSIEANITNRAVMTNSKDALVRDANVTTEIRAKEPALIFSQSEASADTAEIGEIFSYTIAVENKNTGNPLNNMTAKNVKVKIDLDENLTFVQNDSDSAWSCGPSGSAYICTLPSLAVGEKSPPIMIEVKSPVSKYTITALYLSSDKSKKEEIKSIAVDVFNKSEGDLGISIEDDVDPVLAKGVYHYQVTVSNSNDAENVEVTIETVSANNFSLKGQSNSDWSCSQDAKKITCYNSLLTANSDSILNFEVQAPDLNTTLKLEATVASSRVNEVDMTNNSVTETTTIIKNNYDTNHLRAFTKVKINNNDYTNIYGDIITIGNQSLCKSDGSGGCEEPDNPINDLVYQTYANLDGVSKSKGFENASMAKLNIDTDDKIVWAGLYWMGMIDRYKGDTSKIQKASKVFLRHDSNSTYIPVQTHLNKFNWHNATTTVTNIFGYQCVADVTEYVRENRGGSYWVADIQTSEGRNLSAGWSLVVVVQDKKRVPTRTLKNITLFDGFQAVWKNDSYADAAQYPDKVTEKVTGFLTPNSGTITSNVSYFSLEGDKTLLDKISITNKSGTEEFLPYVTDAMNPQDDVMNGTITNADRNPMLANTSGVDIDTFDLSSIMEHGQNETDITIYSEGDRFYLGMFNFSTNMYMPKICYQERITKADYSAPNKNFELGDKIGFDALIRNEENEIAKNVVLKIEVDNIYQETNNTMEMRNLVGPLTNEASFSKHSDLVDFHKDTNITNDANETVNQDKYDMRVGLGASNSMGGSINTGETVYFRYNGIVDSIPDNNLSKNTYKVTYKVDNMPDLPDIEIASCVEQNNSIFITRHIPHGFGIARKNGFTNSDLTSGTLRGDDDVNQNHLYTQLSDEPFSVDLLALEQDKKVGRRHTGEVKLDLVEVNASRTCTDYDKIGENQYVTFEDAKKVTSAAKAYSLADQNLAFRVYYPTNRYGRYPVWPNISGNTLSDIAAMLEDAYGVNNPCMAQCNDTGASLDACRACLYDPNERIVALPSCSNDSFAIRPRSVAIESNSTLTGGKDYNVTFDANASRYNTVYPSNNSKKSVRRELIKPTTCTSIADDNASMLVAPHTLTFVDGNATFSQFHYDNVGDINVSLLDGLWTQVDQNSTDATMSDCIVGSASNVADAQGRFGCNIKGEKLVTFIPSHFNNSLTLTNEANSTYTYLDDSNTIGAKARIMIEAMLEDNTTKATNYTAGCFANDIGYSFGLKMLIPTKTPIYYPVGNSLRIGTGSFSTTEGNFTAGKANVTLGINFARSKTVAQNPFDMNSSQLDIYVQDTDAVDGFDFIADNGMARYYYARMYVPDYVNIEDDDFQAALFYEVYCDESKGCDKADANLTEFPESKDYIHWYIVNPIHNGVATDGYDVASVHALHGLGISHPHTFSVELNLGALKRPYCDSVILKPNAWLRYHPAPDDTASFKACFVSQGAWAGSGDVGMTVDTNISKLKNRKINW